MSRTWSDERDALIRCMDEHARRAMVRANEAEMDGKRLLAEMWDRRQACYVQIRDYVKAGKHVIESEATNE